jgi:cytosine deaminase
VTSLASLDGDSASEVMALLGKAGIHVVTLPATDLYLGGRKEATLNPRRALTPVRALREAGVNVAFASNNIRNAFTPFGAADPLLIGLLLAHAAQLGTLADRASVVRMCTHGAAAVMGIASDYGLAVGKQADLLIVDSFSVADVLLDLPPRLWVIKRGMVTVETQHSCRVHRVFRKDVAS